MADKRQRGPKGPVILDVGETDIPDAPSPAEAPQPTETDGSAAGRAIALAAGSGWGLGRWLLTALFALIAFWIGVEIEAFVSGLLARSGWLGWLALGLVTAVVVLMIAVVIRETAALARLGRVEALRDQAVETLETGSTTAADEVLSGLRRLYRGRADMEWALDRLEEAKADTPDAEARLAIAERTLLAQLDARAEETIRRNARNVAAATALIPLALVDVIAALTFNLSMIRQIAEIYGGRAGWLGSWRLMRAVAAHLAATGAVAVADDMIGPVLGGGVLARFSRRFGEGALNGALTARVGVAATEICRPLPFHDRKRPSASALLLSALSDWRKKAEESADR